MSHLDATKPTQFDGQDRTVKTDSGDLAKIQLF
jgi:hypothetical protein